MTQTYYDVELTKLASTYREALSADVEKLKLAISGASESSIIGVGSGGSYTVASLLCNLHEAYTGRVSRPSTPLELICNPTLASSSPVFLISAEGKNPDIVEALQRARLHSSRTVHVLTNRANSRLMECVQSLTDITPYIFELANKDGYLATNSLLLDAVLIARAYGELDRATENLPDTVDGLKIGEHSIAEWLDGASSFVRQAAPRKGIIVVYSPLLRPVAADLESKLSEAALMYCQFADLRSFAHGRHLWLAERPDDCSILAITEPGLEQLWDRMRGLLPTHVPTYTMALGGAAPKDLLAGLLAQMQLVSMIASELRKDPGKPDVPEFGRAVYYVDLPEVIPTPREIEDHSERSKSEALGARWPLISANGVMRRALENFKAGFQNREFRAIVFDYDGTLCSSQRNDGPPSEAVLEHIKRLASSGVAVGIASGRGGSIQEHLQTALDEAYWPLIRLGLYNGGWIGHVGPPTPTPGDTSEFLSHVRRIVGRLQALGVPIEQIRATHPYQVSVRFKEGVHAENMWFVIADALRQAGLDPSTVVRSKHSVDILGKGVSKSHLVARIVQESKIDPYEVVSMGDQGAWPGNDASLLEHRFSLSVDTPSRRIDRGWKLAPQNKRDVDATLWYLDRIDVSSRGTFSFRLDQFDSGGAT
ncbi:MAG: phosphoglycolate phosphatase [Herminiimonas sp.]|nr:phosphoglycolate phosphatase [Herminiimonas sp.]